jgi:hypothetical protein
VRRFILCGVWSLRQTVNYVASVVFLIVAKSTNLQTIFLSSTIFFIQSRALPSLRRNHINTLASLVFIDGWNLNVSIFKFCFNSCVIGSSTNVDLTISAPFFIGQNTFESIPWSFLKSPATIKTALFGYKISC